MPPAFWKTHCPRYKDQLVVLFRETPALYCGPHRSEGQPALGIYLYLNHNYMLHTTPVFINLLSRPTNAQHIYTGCPTS